MPMDNEYVDAVSEDLYTLYQNLKRIINAGVSNNMLTEPQLSVLKVLTDEDGLSLKELSKRVGLAHSTVSGIVDRLEQRKLLERKVNSDDKRHTQICLSEMVKMHKDTFSQRLFVPVIQKLTSLNADDQSKVLDGLSILNKLMEEE